jgi:DNA-binding IclR family transcriptional regulator
MSSLSRMLKILDLFSDGTTMTAEVIAQRTGLTRSTAYRYVKELCDAGLLGRFSGEYALGPRIIELDWMIRNADPLLAAARPAMASIRDNTGLTVLASELYGDRVINTHIEYTREPLTLSFGRGRPLPLFTGAGSRVIVAHLSASRLRRLHREHAEDPALRGLDWRGFSALCRDIREQGWCLTSGELNRGLTGVAAPVFDRDGAILGSLTAIGRSDRFALFRESAIATMVIDAARSVTATLARVTDPATSAGS